MATATLPPPPAGYTLDSPAPQQAVSASRNLPPPPAGYTLDQGPGGNSASDQQSTSDDRGFWQSAWDQLKGIPMALSDWYNGGRGPGAPIGDAIHVLHQVDQEAAADPANKGKPPAQWERRDLTGDEQAIVDRGLAKAASATSGNALTEFGAPAMTAANQASQGNLPGAAGTLVGGYGPTLAAVTAPEWAPRVASGARAAGDVAAKIPDIPQGAILGSGATAYALGGPHWAAGVTGTLEALNTIKRAVALMRNKPVPAPITPESLGVPSTTIVQPGGYSAAERPAWRQDIIGDLNTEQPAPQPKASPGQQPASSSNQFETAARADKAQKLASFLYLGGKGVTSEEAAMMSPDHWNLAAKAAGTTIPSPATAKAAITQLQKLWDAHAAAQQPSDSMTPPGGPAQ